MRAAFSFWRGVFCWGARTLAEVVMGFTGCGVLVVVVVGCFYFLVAVAV